MTRNNIGPRYWTYCRGVFDERSLPRSDGSPARAAAADPPTRALTTDLELDQARASKGEGRVPNLEVRLLAERVSGWCDGVPLSPLPPSRIRIRDGVASDIFLLVRFLRFHLTWCEGREPEAER